VAVQVQIFVYVIVLIQAFKFSFDAGTTNLINLATPAFLKVPMWTHIRLFLLAPIAVACMYALVIHFVGVVAFLTKVQYINTKAIRFSLNSYNSRPIVVNVARFVNIGSKHSARKSLAGSNSVSHHLAPFLG
jgi:hypothetical protein